MFPSAPEVLEDNGVDMPVVMRDSLVQTFQIPVEALHRAVLGSFSPR